MMIPHMIVCAGCLAMASAQLAAQQPTPAQGQNPAPQQAQDPQRDQKPMLASDWTTLERLLDATCVLAPTSKTGGAPAMQKKVDDASIEIEELIVDSQRGDICWAVISTGDVLEEEKTVAVPFDKLSLRSKGEDGDELQFNLDVSRDKLMSLRKFDLDKAREGHIDVALTGLANDWNKSDKAVGDKPVAHEQTGERVADASMRTTGSYLLASKLDGMDVKTAGTEDNGFGDVSRALVDTRDGSIDFVVASKGGVLGIGETDYLIPFKAAHVTANGDNEHVLKLDKSSTEMKSAVRYKNPDNERDVLDPAVARRACDFFGVSIAHSDMSRRSGEIGGGK